jgi:small-conductance mechanosensitive channel
LQEEYLFYCHMLTQQQILKIVIIVASSFVAGWLTRKMILPFLYRLTHKTKWKSDELILKSIGKWVIFWFFLGACYYLLPILVEAFAISPDTHEFLKDSFKGLYIFSVTWVVADILAGVLQIRSGDPGSEIQSSSILENIIKVIVYCIGLILILQNFGVAIAPLLTALGVGGLAVALALQPTLSNLFSGIHIITSGKMNIGDFIQLENGKSGFIRDITWRNTTIETGQNNMIIIPNSKLADSIVENFFLINREIIFSVPVGVAYDNDLQQVEKISTEVAKEILINQPGGVREFQPVVQFVNFGEGKMELKIILKVKEYADQFTVRSEFIKALHQRYQAENIRIPCPVQQVILEKPDKR